MSARDRLRTNDIRFHSAADGLSADEWTRPSLCDEWSNHEVLAHLVVGYSSGLRPIAYEMIRCSGSFDRANAAMARSLAGSCTPAELLDEFGRLTERPRGLGRFFPPHLLLGDHVTHELDMLLALGREPAIPDETAMAVLHTQVRVPNPFVPAFRNSRGLRLVASDIGWTHGAQGPLVEGRAVHLISVLGNRPKMLDALRGDGVGVLRSRVSPHPIRTGG